MRRLAPALLLALIAAAPAAADPGQAAFTAAAGLEARLARPDGPVLPAGSLTCAGCHGADGNGGTEGGTLRAPPIRWQTLASPTPDRPGYDDAALARLLRDGITPSGRTISARMPRFQGSPEVMAALAAYLRQLDRQEQQGLEPGRLILALPTDPDLRAAAHAAMTAFNAEGGAFGRLAVAGEPAFADLGPVLAGLMPRLIGAEETRLDALLQAEPELRPMTGLTLAELSGPARIAGTLDQLGPHLGALLARPETGVTVIGPPPEALQWAIENGQDSGAAHAYALTRAALELLRDYGRHPTRTGFMADIDRIDPATLIELYRQPPATGAIPPD